MALNPETKHSEKTIAESAEIGVVCSQQQESVESTYDDADLAFTDIIDKFVRAMVAGRGSEERRRLTEAFNVMLDHFFLPAPGSQPG